MKYGKILVAQTEISNIDLIHVPLKVIQEKVENDLARELAKEIIKSDSYEITEEPDFINMTKKFKAEVVVLSKEEYRRLKEIEAAADLAKSMLDII